MNSGDEQKALERRPIFWFYGSSSIAYGIKDNAFSYLLLTFANQALGVPGYLASLALAIAIVWDALTDPLLGHWSDKTQSKLGRRHPFMYAALFICFEKSASDFVPHAQQSPDPRCLLRKKRKGSRKV